MPNVLKLPLAVLIALTCVLGTYGIAYAEEGSSSDSAPLVDNSGSNSGSGSDSSGSGSGSDAAAEPTAPADNTVIVETAESRATCDYLLIENPFTGFGDYLDYVLAPDGSFNDGGAGWQLDDGARVIATDKGPSLQLPEGASAISPSMCLDLNFPTFRMYHKVVKPKTGLNGLVGLVLGTRSAAKIKVEVIYHEVAEPLWTEMSRFTGLQGLLAPRNWMLSDHIDLMPELGGSEPGARQAALRFTAVDTANGESVLFDDVYVDPMRR